MKLTIERADLSRLLSHVGRLSPRGNTIPILSNVLLSAHGSEMTMTGTDCDIFMSDKAPAKIDEPGEITVPAGALLDITRKLPDGAQIALHAADDRIRIQCGRSRFTLHTLPSDNFPAMNTEALPHNFVVPASSLSRLIKKTQFAISTEETRYYLNGIYLHVAKREGRKQLRAVATDGHRMARCDEPMPQDADDMPGIIVPRKAIAEIAKLADGPSASIGIAASESMLRIVAGTVTMTTKLVDGTYPDYARVIPGDPSLRAQADRETLADAVDRVSSIVSSSGRAVKFSIAADTLTLSSTNPDLGNSEEAIDIASNGDLTLGFNGKYAAEVMAVMEGKTIHIGLSSESGPATFRDTEDEALLIVLMPARV